MSLDSSDDLLLDPQLPWSAHSAQDLESFLLQIESYHGVTGLFTAAERDFLVLEGATSLHIDTPSFVYLQEPLLEGIVTSGQNSLWVVKESLGNIKIEGGSTQIFFESIPTESSTITLEQGALELNFLPSLGSRPRVELIGQDDALKTIYIDGQATSLQVQLSEQAIDNGAQLSVLVLDELQVKLGGKLQQELIDESSNPDQDFLFDADSDIVWPENFVLSNSQFALSPASGADLYYDSNLLSTQELGDDAFEPIETVSASEQFQQEVWVDDYITATNTYTMGQFDEFDGIVI